MGFLGGLGRALMPMGGKNALGIASGKTNPLQRAASPMLGGGGGNASPGGAMGGMMQRARPQGIGPSTGSMDQMGQQMGQMGGMMQQPQFKGQNPEAVQELGQMGQQFGQAPPQMGGMPPRNTGIAGNMDPSRMRQMIMMMRQQGY